MIPVVGAVQIAIGTDINTMGMFEEAMSPRAQKVAILIKHNNGVLTSCEEKDRVSLIDRDCGYFTEFQIGGQLGPVLKYLELELSI